MLYSTQDIQTYLRRLPGRRVGAVCIVVFVVSLIIGMPCAIMGCNSFYPYCVHYYPQPDATVLSANVTSEGRCGRNHLECYGYSIAFIYGNGSQKCTANSATNVERGEMNRIFESFPIGSRHTIYVERSNHDACTEDIKKVEDLAIVGVSFLSLAAVGAVGTAGGFLWAFMA